MTQLTQSQRIAQLNDALRKQLRGGQIVVTQGIQAMDEVEQRGLLEAVQAFDAFNEDNDPYGEHDFGSFSYKTLLINWKIDYYDLNMEYHSEDPSDPSKTKRVFTIMLAEEY